MFVQHAHTFYERQLRFIFRKHDLCRRIAAALQGIDERVQVFHIDRYDIQTKQSVAGDNRNRQYLGLHQESFSKGRSRLAGCAYFDNRANAETQGFVVENLRRVLQNAQSL